MADIVFGQSIEDQLAKELSIKRETASRHKKNAKNLHFQKGSLFYKKAACDKILWIEKILTISQREKILPLKTVSSLRNALHTRIAEEISSSSDHKSRNSITHTHVMKTITALEKELKKVRDKEGIDFLLEEIQKRKSSFVPPPSEEEQNQSADLFVNKF